MISLSLPSQRLCLWTTEDMEPRLREVVFRAMGGNLESNEYEDGRSPNDSQSLVMPR